MSTSKKSTMWIALMILGEELWQIDINLSKHETREEAENMAKTGVDNGTFVIVDGRPGIQVYINGFPKLFFDKSVVITEISQEKQARMGRPLDMSVPSDKETAINALYTHDPAYTIEPSDMVPSDKTLADFIDRYGDGYEPDHIAWGVSEICE